MKKLILGSILCASFLSSTTLFASATTLTEWGTSASIISGGCSGDSCSPLGVFLAGMNQELTVGGINELTAAIGVINLPQGNAQALATVTGGSLATPILKAQANATAGSWLGAGAFAIQGYEYTGLSADTVLLNITFDGDITNPDADLATGFGVGMYLFTATQIGFADLLATNPYAVLGALALTAGNSLPVEQIYQLNITADGAVNEIGQLSIDLSSGDQFYLAGGVLAAAGGAGAVADAFSTLTVNFDPQAISSLDVASGSAVPELPIVMMFISALLGWGSLKKLT
ncbi:MAG: hypothetical protein GQ581_02675, partial [Methyloprofundus sp.]|nr:hypothetical protein [Methyloprofundus sp.]